MAKKRAQINTDACVACGCCVKVCPRAALTVDRGLFACVDYALCVGCAKCERVCPACVITMEVAE